MYNMLCYNYDNGTALLNHSFTGVFGASGSKTSLMNVLMNLRKCVNHPYLFDGEET